MFFVTIRLPYFSVLLLKRGTRLARKLTSAYCAVNQQVAENPAANPNKPRMVLGSAEKQLLRLQQQISKPLTHLP